MVVMDQFTRRVIGFATHRGGLKGIAMCCMFNKIMAKQTLPKYLRNVHEITPTTGAQIVGRFKRSD